MRSISGILGTPRVSRNKNFYFPEELKRGHNVTVPLRWNHIQAVEGIIGSAKLNWDEDLMQLRYTAMVDNPTIEALLGTKEFKTSLGVLAGSHVETCHPSGTCYSTPINVEFKEMSIVENPGIPESSVNLMEKYDTTENIFFDEQTRVFTINDNIKPDITSKECACTETNIMSDIIPKQEDTTVQVKSVDPVAAEPAPAPAPVVIAAPVPAAPAPAATEATCQPGCTGSKPAEVPPAAKAENVDVEKLVAERVELEIEKLQKQIRETYEPKAQVSESVFNALDTEETIEKQVSLMEKVLEGQSVSIKLDKEAFIASHTAIIPSPFQEAVNIAGTIPGILIGSQIVILPGGIKVKPIRQWLQVKKIPQGDDTVRFYTLDVPAFGVITEHVSTEITPATTTLTGIDVTANVVRGFRQNVLKSEVERYPRDLLEKIRETARIRSVEDEAANTLITIATSTAVDYGANHFSATLGTLVTDETDEENVGEFLGLGIEAAVQRLQEQGHDPENGGAVCALTPRAMRTLSTDPALIRYLQVGDASITRQGRMSVFFGVELWVTNTINTTSGQNSARNVVFMKGKTFGLAVGRDLELEFDKNINRQSVDIVATHRVNSVILDATAYVILSSDTA